MILSEAVWGGLGFLLGFCGPRLPPWLRKQFRVQTIGFGKTDDPDRHVVLSRCLSLRLVVAAFALVDGPPWNVVLSSVGGDAAPGTPLLTHG